jgi:phospholipase/lecithinase/hemolysin
MIATIVRTSANTVVAVCCVLAAAAAQAGIIPTRIYAFGDSLSDGGRAATLTVAEFPPSPPYANRFSNGPVAVEWLAQAFGLTLDPFLPATLNGTNFAVGGAMTGAYTVELPPPAPAMVTNSNFNWITGVNNVVTLPPGFVPGSPLAAVSDTGIPNQVQSFLGTAPSFDPASTLFVVWGGANDFFLAQALGQTNPAAAIANLAGAVAALAAAGGDHFLVPGLPDFSLTPAFLAAIAPLPPDQQAILKAQLQAQVLGFNAALAGTMDGLEEPLGIEIVNFDTFAAVHAALPLFANVTEPCLSTGPGGVPVICSNPDAFLFWDEVHPTTAAHRLLGLQFAAAVPEPGALALAAVALLALAMARRRARA